MDTYENAQTHVDTDECTHPNAETDTDMDTHTCNSTWRKAYKIIRVGRNCFAPKLL